MKRAIVIFSLLLSFNAFGQFDKFKKVADISSLPTCTSTGPSKTYYAKVEYSWCDCDTTTPVWVCQQTGTGTVGPTGPSGADGQTILSGTIDPTTEGSDGDFYINTTSDTIWGPKAGGSWAGTSENIVGPTGPSGSDGSDGAAGADGADGADGATGAIGPTGPVNATDVAFTPDTGGEWTGSPTEVDAALEDLAPRVTANDAKVSADGSVSSHSDVTGTLGSLTTLVTGTAGTSGHCAEWDGNFDLVSSGAACGVGGNITLGTDTTGDYVAAATVNAGLLMTGGEGGTLGLLDSCGVGYIVKSDGAGAWSCGTDETGSEAAFRTHVTPLGTSIVAEIPEDTLEWLSGATGLLTITGGGATDSITLDIDDDLSQYDNAVSGFITTDTNTNASTICSTNQVLGGAADGCIASGSSGNLYDVQIADASGGFTVDASGGFKYEADKLYVEALEVADPGDGSRAVILLDNGAAGCPSAGTGETVVCSDAGVLKYEHDGGDLVTVSIGAHTATKRSSLDTVPGKYDPGETSALGAALTWPWGKHADRFAVNTTDGPADDNSGIVWSEKYRAWFAITNGISNASQIFVLSENGDKVINSICFLVNGVCATIKNADNDLEDIAITDPFSDYIYIMLERTGTYNTVGIYEYYIPDIMTTTQDTGLLSPTDSWTVNESCCTAGNCAASGDGYEGIAFVPDSSICGTAPNVPCGYFVTACQLTDNLYFYKLDDQAAAVELTSSPYSSPKTISSLCGTLDFAEGAGLDWDWETGTLLLSAAGPAALSTDEGSGKLAFLDRYGDTCLGYYDVSLIVTGTSGPDIDNEDFEGVALDSAGRLAVCSDDGSYCSIFYGQMTSRATEGSITRADCSGVAIDGQQCWDHDADILYVGDGTAPPTAITGGSGAPTDVNYLVGTADATLSAAIVVGTTPGGVLGGTWAAPTIDDDSIGTAALNDAADTPAAGECLKVATTTSQIEYGACATGAGDVSSVGNCTGGACYDGSSDGGTYAALADTDGDYVILEVVTGTLTAIRSARLPDETGKIVITQTVCKTVENLADTDDNFELFMSDRAMNIKTFGCYCKGTCTTAAQLSLENRAGTALTHTTPTCATGTGNATFQAVTAETGGNPIAAGGGLRFDVDNAVSPETDEYTICFTFTHS